MTEENLEKKITENDQLDLSRIALTTFGYGLAGLSAPNPDIAVPISALCGCAFSIYDEITKSGLDLSIPAIAAVTGCFIGSLFNNPTLKQQIPDLTTYLGATVGFVLGTYNSIKGKKY